jgi:hypothetical protein
VRKGLNAIWFDKLTMTTAQLIPKTKARCHPGPVEGRAKALTHYGLIKLTMTAARLIQKQKARCHPEPVEGRAKALTIMV